MSPVEVYRRDLEEFLDIVRTRLKDRLDNAQDGECPRWFTASAVWSNWDDDPRYDSFMVSRILLREASMLYDLVRLDPVLMMEKHQRVLIENARSLFFRVVNHKGQVSATALSSTMKVIRYLTDKLKTNAP